MSRLYCCDEDAQLAALRELESIRDRTSSDEVRQLSLVLSLQVNADTVVEPEGSLKMVTYSRSHFESVRWLAIRQMSWEELDILSDQSASELLKVPPRRLAAQKAVAALIEKLNDESVQNRLAAIEALRWYGRHDVLQHEIVFVKSY